MVNDQIMSNDTASSHQHRYDETVQTTSLLRAAFLSPQTCSSSGAPNLQIQTDLQNQGILDPLYIYIYIGAKTPRKGGPIKSIPGPILELTRPTVFPSFYNQNYQRH